MNKENKEPIDNLELIEEDIKERDIAIKKVSNVISIVKDNLESQVTPEDSVINEEDIKDPIDDNTYESFSKTDNENKTSDQRLREAAALLASLDNKVVSESKTDETDKTVDKLEDGEDVSTEEIPVGKANSSEPISKETKVEDVIEEILDEDVKETQADKVIEESKDSSNYDNVEYTESNDAESSKVDNRDANDIYISNDDLKRLESLSDDEAVIELDKLTGQNDELIEKDYLSSLVSQDDRLVYYEVENIYSNPKNNAFKNRLKMRRDPPVLVVKDDFGNEAKFYLTENLTDELSETLRQVKRAYHGFNNPSDINMPKKFVDRVKYYVKNNPLKILASIFILLFIISLVL